LREVCSCTEQLEKKQPREKEINLIARLDVTHQKADILMMAVDEKRVAGLNGDVGVRIGTLLWAANILP
jgi:hypothetical protein